VLKKTIKYTDFNGQEVEEDLYFHLSKAELVELEMSTKGGLSESLKRIVASEDGKKIIAEFKNIILSSYGQRSDDGHFFKKNQELRDEFQSSEAYSTLFMELVTNTDAAIEFITGIVPAGLAEEAAEIARKEMQPELAAVPDEPGNGPEEVNGSEEVQMVAPSDDEVGKNVEVISNLALIRMSQEELADAGRRVAAGEAVYENDPDRPAS
jgi:hypothetical protein